MKLSSFGRLPPAARLAVLAALLEAAFLVVRRLHPLDEKVPEVVAAGLAASLVYFGAVCLVFSWGPPAATGPPAAGHSPPAALKIIFGAALLFRLTLFALPPTLSDDFYRYQWEGAVQVAGRNPYLVTPADPAGAGLRPAAYERLPGPRFVTPYAPLTELLFWLAAWLDGPPGFKLLSVGFDLATLLVVLAILRALEQPLARALLYAWCPLVVLEFAGSGHNDSIALFFLLLANLAIIRRRQALSIAALAAAVMAKWFPAVAAPVFLGRKRAWGWLVFASTLLALCLPYRAAGWNLLRGLLAYAGEWRNNPSLYGLLGAATGDDRLAAGIALGVVAGVSLHCAAAGTPPLRASFLLLAAVLLLSPSLFPWYVTWLVPFLCFFPHPALLLFTATVLLSYHVVIGYSALGQWRYTGWLVWLEYVPVYALLLWRGWPRQWRGWRAGPPSPNPAAGRTRA